MCAEARISNTTVLKQLVRGVRLRMAGHGIDTQKLRRNHRAADELRQEQ